MPLHNKGLTVDTPFGIKKQTPRTLIKVDNYLNRMIFGEWHETIEKVRHKLKLLDYVTFGDHKWFREFYDLPRDQQTSGELKKRLNDFITQRRDHFFIDPANTKARSKWLFYLQDWCEKANGGSFAIENATIITRFAQWHFANKLEYETDNKYKAQYGFLKDGVSTWQFAMEIQGWYDYKPDNRSNPRVKMDLSNDGDFGALRVSLKKKSNMFIKKVNKPVATARRVTKVLPDQLVEDYVVGFNSISRYNGTPMQVRRALRFYSITAFNFNIGMRVSAVCNFCYSWMMHGKADGFGGIYVNYGNPLGHKRQGNLQDFVRTDFFVRHADVRQCPVGALIKMMVAEYDILKVKSLFDMIEESIVEREEYIEMLTHEPKHAQKPKRPAWYDYRLIQSDANTNEPLSSSTYHGAIKTVYRHINAHDLRAITHEPHSRVAVFMQEKMGVPKDQVAEFQGWESKQNTTVYDVLYSRAALHTSCALARSAHTLWKDVIYACPRDGSNDDLRGFEDMQSLLFQGRVPGLLHRARVVHHKLAQLRYLDDSDATAVLFLELINDFLIRVWLEDAAILQHKFPNSVCYKTHQVFHHPDWPRFVKHMAKLRELRGETKGEHESEVSLPPASLPKPEDKLHDLMRKSHVNMTVDSLYKWHKRLDTEWKSLYPNDRRGISKSEWEAANALANRTLYQNTRHVYNYIRGVVKNDASLRTKQVIDRVQAAIDDLGTPIREVVATQFRILVGKGEDSKEARRLKMTKEQLAKALEDQGLPSPFDMPSVS